MNKINKYIIDNYDKLLKAAEYITKDETAGDLLHIVIEQILNMEKATEKIKNSNNLYNYIVRAMTYQKYSSMNTKYKKDFILHNLQIYYTDLEYIIEYFDNMNNEEIKDDIFDDIIDFIEETDLFEDEIICSLSGKTNEDEIKRIKNKYKFKNKIYKQVFYDYFYFEKNNNIKDMSKCEVDSIRKMSYRKLSEKYKISHMTIFSYIKHILYKIEQKYI